VRKQGGCRPACRGDGLDDAYGWRVTDQPTGGPDRRGYVIALVVLSVGGLTLLVAHGRTWASAAVGGSGLPTVQASLSGHPSAPILSAALALAEERRASGADLLTAFVVGVEIEAKLGRAVNPAHYEVGWHATGSVGAFGAAVAAGKLLGLDETRMCHAIGLAATQPVGLREMFGSMTKSFHPGRAAQNGLFAALLAETVRAGGKHLVFTADEAVTTSGSRLGGRLLAFGYDAREQAAVVRYDAVWTAPGGTVSTKRFEAKIPGVAAKPEQVGPALNRAANQVAAQVAEWLG